ncbi:hypothetical protein [Piscirickettsia litoralis]|uniref:SH3b domain-containing protein n=1 Tax=Piscirickettsia litoralis TaxID=1891921 RepID=A0ABX3A173_9GAMM|nr:hypothetical protein [Piscirickettsia litoralis]ODN42384.1 hypothetical protein BGC07_04840 [Piscirickettsia litoralis]
MRFVKVMILVLILAVALLSGAWAGLKSKSNHYIVLYSAPNEHAKVVEDVGPSRQVVAIYQVGQWLKVGDLSNGQVGWVKLNTVSNIKRAVVNSINERVLIQALQQQMDQLERFTTDEQGFWLQSDTPVLEFYITPRQQTA